MNIKVLFCCGDGVLFLLIYYIHITTFEWALSMIRVFYKFGIIIITPATNIYLFRVKICDSFNLIQHNQ